MDVLFQLGEGSVVGARVQEESDLEVDGGPAEELDARIRQGEREGR